MHCRFARTAFRPARPRARPSRRAVALAALALALAGSVAAGAIAIASASRPAAHHGYRVAGVATPPGPPSHAMLFSIEQQHRSWGLETAAQVTAVRRLAAYGLPLFCAGAARPMVALTFDDGPGVYTHLAIKKLREFGLRATFFLVGKEIRAWSGWAHREAPYAVFGDHTMTHPFLPALARMQMVRQIAGAKALIERTVGEPVVLFRPPYGGRSGPMQQEARLLGMLDVMWNVDSGDSLGANYAGIERNVIHGLRPGSIILMHENHGQTIRALTTIFSALARRHLEAVTLPQLIADDPPSRAQLRAGEAGCGIRSRGGNGG